MFNNFIQSFSRMRKSFLIVVCICFFISANLFAQTFNYSGRVIDVISKKPLAFVSVTINGQQVGLQTDIDGKFLIKSSKENIDLRFAYVGYETKVETFKAQSNILVSLKSIQVSIKVVEVLAGENPAHRIIKKAIQNRKLNNPENLTSFRYNAYNKFIFTSVIDSGTNNFAAQNKFDSLKNPAKFKARDSVIQKNARNRKSTDSLLEKQYVFMTESVSQRDFMFPDLNKETIKASRISGLKSAPFVLIASQFQSFSFYKDYIDVLDKKYLSPISPNSFNNYFFNIEDTLFQANDTVFVISFKPMKGKNFEGMKGLIYINSLGFAIQNVIAEPAINLYFGIKIQQQYELIGNKYWFPTQLNTDLDFKNYVFVGGGRLMGIGRTYLKDIEIGLALEKKKFDAITIDYDKSELKNSEELINKFRIDTLNLREKRTYEVLDSIGKAEKLDEKIKIFSVISKGYIPWGYIQFDLRKFFAGINDYEGFRFGVGIATSEKLTKYFSVNSYVAYGTKDKAIKYGGGLEIPISAKRQANLSIIYKNDLNEVGSTNIRIDKISGQENYRSLVTRQYDKIELYEGNFKFRSFKYLGSTLYLNQSNINVIGGYNFGFNANSQYQYYETGMSFKYAFKEKLMKQGSEYISLGTDYPTVYLQLAKGARNFQLTNGSYHKVDLKIIKSCTLRNIGVSSMLLNAGKVFGNVPISFQYFGKANYNGKININSKNNFETMYVNEFLSNEYISIFLAHDFGKLLMKTEKFQPSLAIRTNVGFGKLDNASSHNGIIYKQMNKGYFESGIVISDLIRFNSNLYNTGLGIGIYYRYGNYAFVKAIDNLVAKIDFKISF